MAKQTFIDLKTFTGAFLTIDADSITSICSVDVDKVEIFAHGIRYVVSGDVKRVLAKIEEARNE